MAARGILTRASPRTMSSSVSNSTVDSASRTAPFASVTRTRHLVSYPTGSSGCGDRGGCRLATEVLAERAQVGINGRGVTHDESRNEAENRVRDPAALRDRHAAGVGTVGGNVILPLPTE